MDSHRVCAAVESVEVGELLAEAAATSSLCGGVARQISDACRRHLSLREADARGGDVGDDARATNSASRCLRQCQAAQMSGDTNRTSDVTASLAIRENSI